VWIKKKKKGKEKKNGEGKRIAGRETGRRGNIEFKKRAE